VEGSNRKEEQSGGSEVYHELGSGESYLRVTADSVEGV
jgi:hypothetical protein